MIMDVVVIFNGLGNQMSQYAFFLAKKKRNSHCKVIFLNSSRNNHNGSELEKLFGVSYETGILGTLLQLLYKLSVHQKTSHILECLGVRIIKEPLNYDFNPTLLNQGKRGINFYWGGWHCEKNFNSAMDEVRNAFRFPEIEDKPCLDVAYEITKVVNSVSLHVRRGDYLNTAPNAYYQFDGVATTDYYKKAVEIIKTKNNDCVFFVFSNDIEWCKKNFSNLNAIYVNCNKGENSWRDMYLMTLCKHHINANSTFSWWGAWLSNNNGMTICPSSFLKNVVTKDIYPENWIKI